MFETHPAFGQLYLHRNRAKVGTSDPCRVQNNGPQVTLSEMLRWAEMGWELVAGTNILAWHGLACSFWFLLFCLASYCSLFALTPSWDLCKTYKCWFFGRRCFYWLQVLMALSIITGSSRHCECIRWKFFTSRCSALCEKRWKSRLTYWRWSVTSVEYCWSWMGSWFQVGSLLQTGSYRFVKKVSTTWTMIDSLCRPFVWHFATAFW